MGSWKLSKLQRTGYDYVPVAGEDYYPQGKPSDTVSTGTVIADNGKNKLVKQPNGDIVLTDQNGNRPGD
jgi:hypothetical protein